MPPVQSAVATLRRGDEVVHIYTESLAVKILSKAGNHDYRRSPADVPVPEAGVLPKAQLAASSSLDAILQVFPELTGSASTSLATALRVRPVRDTLSGHAVRGIPLTKWIGYVASAADAGRHLSVGIIDEVIAELHHVMVPPVPLPIPLADTRQGLGLSTPLDSASREEIDFVWSHDPWANVCSRTCITRPSTSATTSSASLWAQWRPVAPGADARQGFSRSTPLDSASREEIDFVWSHDPWANGSSRTCNTWSSTSATTSSASLWALWRPGALGASNTLTNEITSSEEVESASEALAPRGISVLATSDESPQADVDTPAATYTALPATDASAADGTGGSLHRAEWADMMDSAESDMMDPVVTAAKVTVFEEMSHAEKAADPLFNVAVRKDSDGTTFYAVVDNIQVVKESRERLYLIRYSDGDVEHLTASQVVRYIVF